jgi:CBS domain-containing protein
VGRIPHECDQVDLLRALHQVRRIPVVGDGQRLLGIIAQADIATRMDSPRRIATLVEEISQPSAG